MPSTLKLFVLSAIAVSAANAAAQQWPSKPITIVVSYPAGGDTDASARIYAEKLSIRLGQPVVVENKPGAGGIIGNFHVAKAKADGYTLLYANSTLPIVQNVLKVGTSVAYDPVNDFTPIIRDQNIPLVMVTSADSGIKSVRQLVQEAKDGKRINYGSPSTGTPMHIAAEIFNKAAGVKIPHVPYKGSAPLVADLLGNHVSVGWTTPGVAIGHVKEGKLIALALAEPKRTKLQPDVPTFLELGYKDVQMSAWQGLMGPRGLPADVVRVLNTHMNEIIKLPDVQTKLDAMGIEPVGGTPDAFATQVADDAQRFGVLIKEFGIQAE
ncbi:MAG: tripartite tricarboxylate transporter substrate binding protein [Burkholderiaceae bacterium]|nr:tripartite tricarboxylate transporter substrate binding protein [Burkholderiaceae bacterium]